MYPLLEPHLGDWFCTTSQRLAALAGEHRAELASADEAGVFPDQIYRSLGRLGFIGLLTPVEYGGCGRGAAEYCVVAEECAVNGLVSVQTAVQGQRWLLEWGTDAQKSKYLPGLCSGETVFSESISEPRMGSSFKQMEATACRTSDGDWILNGEKTHVNLGLESHVTIFYGITEQGLTSFLVDTSTSGITRTRTDPIGLRLIPTADVLFTDVRVDDDALLAQPGQGMATFLSTFNLSRLGNASELIGFARRAMTMAVDYACQRRVADDVVTGFQGIRWKLADVYDSIYAATLARDRAALIFDSGRDCAFETSLAKKMAIDAAEKAAAEMFALTGGHGLYRDRGFHQLLCDIKVLRTAGGSHEVLRNYVAARILRSPSYEGLRWPAT